MTGPAAARWRETLEQWALPEDLLENASESPYGWSSELWKRRAQLALEQGSETPTSEAVRALLPVGGRLLDVGAGTGRASLQHARQGHPVTAVEKNLDLVDQLRAQAAEQSLAVATLEGSWPEIAESVGMHDVAICAHVVYDVQDLVPFLAALTARASVGVVVELTPAHPWSGLSPYYRALHGLDRPSGPTYRDFVVVVEGVSGVLPQVEVWNRPGQVWFESWDEILDHYQKRLVLPADRREELRDVLRSQVVGVGGRLYVGSRDRTIVTVWWRT